MSKTDRETGLTVRSKLILDRLRQDPEFHLLMKELPRTSLLPWSHNRPYERWVYQSGVIEGEERIINILTKIPLGNPNG